MDIKEKAQEYAKDKIQQVLNDAVAEAYMEGYKQGYDDGKAEVPVKHENDEMEFVDLGLPSGTLWAKDYLKVDGEIVYLPYLEAKNYKLPTKEQFEELIQLCQSKNHGHYDYGYRFDGKEFIGPNGNSIQINDVGFREGQQRIFSSKCQFWIQNNETNGMDRMISSIGEKSITTENTFMGYKLPILLVK